MTATNKLSGQKLATLPFGNVAPRGAHRGRGCFKKALRDWLYVSGAKASHIHGHWNCLDHFIVFSTKKKMKEKNTEVGGEAYGDRLHVDLTTGEVMFTWGGSPYFYANGSYDRLLDANNQDPVYLYARKDCATDCILFGRMQLVSWVEGSLKRKRRPVVTFRLVDAPANAAALYPELFS